MIYERVNEDEPLRQGDILYPLPALLNLDLNSVILIDEDGNLQEPARWEDIVASQNEFDAKVTLQSYYGIVATQDCDALRNDLISFFQIDSFNEIAGNDAPRSTRRLKYLNYLMEGSETKGKNKWFYLPESELVGFEGKKAVDFEVIFQVPRTSLLDNISFLRKGRLNDRAMKHFQRTLSNYITRYAHDKSYSLTRAEFIEYNNLLPDNEKVQPIGDQAEE